MAITMCRSPKCTSDVKNSGQPCVDPTVTYVGRVLATRERNGYDDSDFYATVWDDETNAPKSIMYASTAFWTYHNSAKIDATPEIRAKYDALISALRAEQTRLAEEEAARRPSKGKVVRSLTTRGKNVGVTGTVMWYGLDRYNTSRWNEAYRVGIKVNGEANLRYLPADKVEVIA